MGNNTEKKPWTNLQTYTKNEAKGLRAITKGGAIEKNSNIAIAIFEFIQ